MTDVQVRNRPSLQSGPKKSAVVLRVITSSIINQFKEIPLLESLLNFQKDFFVIFATYLQNVTTLPCKMANNVRAHLPSGVLQITGSNTVINTCIE